MNKRTFLINFILVFIVMSQFTFTLEIKNVIRTEKEKLFLSDVIETKDVELKRKASKIQVAYSPKPGKESYIKGDYIKLKMKQLKYDIENLEFPEEILILRDYQVLELKILKKIIESKIIKYYTDPNILIRVELKEREDLKLALGHLTIDFNDYRIKESKLGKISLSVDLLLNGDYYNKISVIVEIGKTQNIFVLNDLVKRGDIFYKSLVEEKEELIYKEFKSVEENFNLDELEGKTFKRNMRIGSKISSEDFEKRKIFKRNSKVIILLNYNGIKIKARGKALENGYEGEEVRILNEKTKKVINGKVNGDGTVIMEF